MDTVKVFELHLQKTPPSANSTWKYRKAGRGNVYLAQEVLDFRKTVRDLAEKWRVDNTGTNLDWDGACRCNIRICPIRRKFDTDNVIKCTLDALQESCVLKDDNCVTEIWATKCLCRKCKDRFHCEIIGYPNAPFPPRDDWSYLEKECLRKSKKRKTKK